MNLKFSAALALLASMTVARAQEYPSPVYKNVTVQGALTSGDASALTVGGVRLSSILGPGGITASMLASGAAAANIGAPSVTVRGGPFAQPDYVDATGLGSAANAGNIFDVHRAYGGSVANAVAALNAAGGGTLYFAGGTNTNVSGATTLGANTSVLCGSGATIWTSSPTADTFVVTGYSAWIKGCTFSTTVERTGGAYLNLQSVSFVDNVIMNDGFIGVNFANGAIYTVTNSYIYGLNNAGILCGGAGDSHIIGVTINAAWNFSGYISGNLLYVTTPNPVHTIAAGDGLQGAIAQGTYILSGTSSPYTLNNSQTAGSSGSPIILADVGNAIGVNVVGGSSQIGCSVTITDSGILSGKYGLYVQPPSGYVDAVLVQNSYLDNSSNNAVAIAPQAGGIVAFVRVKNSELGPNTSIGGPVLISGATGSTILELDISGNSVYSYAPANYGLSMTGASPGALIFQGNTIGVAGGTLGTAFKFNQSGDSNAIITGNISKATAFFSSANATDSSCILALNKINGGSITPGACHQSVNY